MIFAPRLRSAIIAAVLFGLLPHSAVAQKNDAGKITATSVSVGSNSGVPGTAIVIPIRFVPAPAVKVSRLKLKLSFPSARLKFEKLEPGLEAKSGNLKVSSTVHTGKDEKRSPVSILTVLASSPRAIQPGFLAYLNFWIKASCPPGPVPLRVTAEANQAGTGEPLPHVHAADGHVLVHSPDEPPSFSCFFFSH